jgi:prevent-host-death family protein
MGTAATKLVATWNRLNLELVSADATVAGDRGVVHLGPVARPDQYDYSSHMRKLQLRDVKANLSAVVDEAVRGKPAVITRHGKSEAVILSFAEWTRLSHVPSFGRLLMAAPLTSADVPKRDRVSMRRSGL